jgi:hypothetical protein
VMSTRSPGSTGTTVAGAPVITTSPGSKVSQEVTYMSQSTTEEGRLKVPEVAFAAPLT